MSSESTPAIRELLGTPRVVHFVEGLWSEFLYDKVTMASTLHRRA